ncbi:MAG: phosphate ABC transporter permease PstA [Myxococcales bacterium]|nr:MAG: phosphate ABC transporter permease PstA [Myxococcales bacterium]
MSDPSPADRWSSPEMRARLRRRHAAERRFRWLGLAAVGVAMLALATLLGNIIGNGSSAFVRTQIALDVHFDPAQIGPLGDFPVSERVVRAGDVDWAVLVRDALSREFPDVAGRRDLRALQGLVSSGARSLLRARVLEDPGVIGQTLRLWVPAASKVDALEKGQIPRDPEAPGARLSAQELGWIASLEQSGRLERAFNWAFLYSGDSREAELAGVGGAIVGSLLTLLVTLGVAFPLGVAAAVYLEEFAQRNRWTDLIEVNINNLAAVPSIVFGLLGLALFLNTMHLPRSAPLVGGLTLALMTLPTIIIAGRSAIQAVPPSIREAARGLGASPLQVVAHHVLPLALPGILTGTIIGMARALGETAPLLMIGMVAFVVDVPEGFSDASTALPVQIYLWADTPERGFVEKVSGAIMVLLGFLILMNGTAIWLRQKFERRW